MALLLSRFIKCISQKKYMTSIIISSNFYKLNIEKNIRHYCKKHTIPDPHFNILKRPLVQLSRRERAIKRINRILYYGSIVGGGGFGIYIIYMLVAELLFNENPSEIYQEAYKLCTENKTVQEILGEHVHVFVDQFKTHKRHHMSHRYYKLDGITYVRMQFYLIGSKCRGTACLEVAIDSEGEHDYVYLYVKANNATESIIVLEDHRGIEEYQHSDFSDS